MTRPPPALGDLKNGVFAQANRAGSQKGELFDQRGIIRLRFDSNPFPFVEPGSWIEFNASVGEINACGAGFRRVQDRALIDSATKKKESGNRQHQGP